MAARIDMLRSDVTPKGKLYLKSDYDGKPLNQNEHISCEWLDIKSYSINGNNSMILIEMIPLFALVSDYYYYYCKLYDSIRFPSAGVFKTFHNNDVVEMCCALDYYLNHHHVCILS